ncbi:MAG: PD-(D/E)XK nuclease family protein [Nanoarchaeota archaeon]
MDKNLNYISFNDKYADKIHISFSEFSLFNQCGHRHLIEKHLKLTEPVMTVHLFFGNAIHSALEKTLKDAIGLSRRIDHFKRTFAKDMLDYMKDEPGFQQDLNDYLQQGEELLSILSIEDIFKKYKIVSVEEPLFEHIYGEFYFKGFVDLVVQDRETGRYVIIDWKTSGQKWSIKKKMDDDIFLCQMRFYKYFWSRKNNIPLGQVDCEYIVLNRLMDKNKADSGCGGIQNIEVGSTNDEIFESLTKLADTVESIHISKRFPKIKHIGNEFLGCMFCKFKGGKHPMCNSNVNQDKQLLLEYKSKIKNHGKQEVN